MLDFNRIVDQLDQNCNKKIEKKSKEIWFSTIYAYLLTLLHFINIRVCINYIPTYKGSTINGKIILIIIICDL